MTTTIKVTDTINLVYKVHTGASIGCYSPQVFVQGGKEVYNPSVGEKTITKDKWVDIQSYYTSLPDALRWCAQYSLDNHAEPIPIKEYLEMISGMWKEGKRKHC